MKIYLTFFLLLIINSTFGQVTNIKTGLWSDTAVWSNKSIPEYNTNIILNYDITVDYRFCTCNTLNANGHKITVNPGVFLFVFGTNPVDFDGNYYDTVTIGSQVWMKENLKVTHYRDGTPIQNITVDSLWKLNLTGAYSNYNNDTQYVSAHGRLYNWQAVNNPAKLCPAKWHVPSDSEWTILINYLGGETDASKAIKDTGTRYWFYNNMGATNSTGFTAIPGGSRREDGSFEDIGGDALWWSSTEYNTISAMYRYLPYDLATIFSGFALKTLGYSVRCLRD